MEHRTGIVLPEKARWNTYYDDGSERTTIEVDVNNDALKVVIDPDESEQWCSIAPDDLVWLAARLLDAHAMLAQREQDT